MVSKNWWRKYKLTSEGNRRKNAQNGNTIIDTIYMKCKCTLISLLPQYLWLLELVGCDMPWRGPTHKVTWPFDHVVLWDDVTNSNHYISTTTMPMTTKLGGMLPYLEWILPNKSYDHIIKWCCCKIIWQTKIIIYPLIQYLYLLDLGGWEYTMYSFLP